MKLFKTFSTVASTSLDVANDLFLTAKQGSRMLVEEAVKARMETCLDTELDWNNSAEIEKAMKAVENLSVTLREFALK